MGGYSFASELQDGDVNCELVTNVDVARWGEEDDPERKQDAAEDGEEDVESTEEFSGQPVTMDVDAKVAFVSLESWRGHQKVFLGNNATCRGGTCKSRHCGPSTSGQELRQQSDALPLLM